jgi:hypothetical protein
VSQTIEVESIRRVDIKPGEILEVTLPPGTDADTAQRVHALLTAELPDVKILLMSAGVDLQVLCPSSRASTADG